MAKTLTLIFNLALLFGMSQTISGPLIPVFVKEFSIRYDRIGFIFFIGLFFGMLAATIFGRLSDRLGRKLVINLGIGLLASGILGVIFSFYAISFAISYCLMNLGFGSLEAGITTGAAELGETNLSFVLTGFSKFSSLGAFLGPLILFTILYFTQYWRIIFILIFIALIVILGIFLKIKYPKKEYHEGHNISLKSKDIINPVILTGAAVLFFHNGVIILFGAWLTTYFSTFEIKLESSILIVSFFWLSVLLGATSAQRIIKKIEEKKYLIIIALISPLVLSVITFSSNITVKFIFSFIFGLPIAGIYPLLLSILFSNNPKIIGGIFSLLGFVGYSSVMIFQLITGYSVENFGKTSIMLIILTNSIICFILILLTSRYKTIAERNINR